MSISFAPSTLWQSWAQRIRVRFIKGPLLTAIAAVLGDTVIDWGNQSNFESLAQYCSPGALGLIGAQRIIDRGPTETDDGYALRLTYAIPMWRFSGKALGILVALYYAGFPGAVIVQQNGLAFSLSGAPNLDDIAAAVPGGPLPSWFVKTRMGTLIADETPETRAQFVSPPATKQIPAGNVWTQFDFNTDLCSRFEVWFPGPLPSWFFTSAVAVFSGTDSASVVWNNPFSDTTYLVEPSVPVGSPVSVYADPATQTKTGVTIRASSAFTGTANVIAYQVGANPYADLHPQDLARLRSTIDKWRPAKATCRKIRALVYGRFWGYPPITWAQNTTWQPGSVATFEAQ